MCIRDSAGNYHGDLENGLGDLCGHDVHVVALSHCSKTICMLNPCRLENLDVESDSSNRSSIELVAEPAEVVWIAVYNSHVMAFFREFCGKLSAKSPTTNDNNIHSEHLLANP